MKIGIVIMFHNNEKNINKTIFIEELNRLQNVEICFVNNDSKDKTFNKLKDIEETCANVSIINIKKYQQIKPAIRAGVRYLSNTFNITNIVYINYKHINLNELKNIIINNQDDFYKKNSIDVAEK